MTDPIPSPVCGYVEKWARCGLPPGHKEPHGAWSPAVAAPSPRQDPEPLTWGERLEVLLTWLALHGVPVADSDEWCRGEARFLLRARPSSLPSREEVERAVDAVIRAARVEGVGGNTRKGTDAARAALLSLIPYRSDR